jgi:hypothetical protein
MNDFLLYHTGRIGIYTIWVYSQNHKPSTS